MKKSTPVYQQLEVMGAGRSSIPALDGVINLTASHDPEFTVNARSPGEALRASGEEPTSPPPAQTSSGRMRQKGG